MRDTQAVECEICKLAFPSRNRLFSHLRTKHDFQRSVEDDSSNHLLRSAQERTAASNAARSCYYNRNHDAYYRRQCQAGVLSVEDWDMAKEFFRKPLGVAFRLHSPPNGGTARKEYVRLVLESNGNGANLENCPFLAPGSCRVAKVPPREWSAEAQQALSDAQDVGAVNRQELCSMIPPLLLFQPPDNATKQRKYEQEGQPRVVLDLCAAPGSKSLQLLDLLTDRYDAKGSCQPSGASNTMLVANDANRSRLLTVARRSRLASDRRCLVLNSSDGRYFPALRKWGGYKLKFHAVLADVPCSGDGTLRKLSSKEWQQWNVKHHMTLHKLQVRLLVRALELVHKGGRVVYSTCSLDPIEDEAVVASAIARMGGPSLYRIVKPARYLEEGAQEVFTYSPGATNWVVPHPKFKSDNPVVYDNFYDAPKAIRRKDITASMFPPSTKRESEWTFESPEDGSKTREEELEQLRFFGDVLSDNNVEALHDMLPNCCRILPQHLDSGGFFCAVIERVQAEYFAVCCPLQRGTKTENNVRPQWTHHGRIYYPVPSLQLLREMLALEKAQGMEVYFEGLPTLDTAQAWLRQHGAYVEGTSESAIALPVEPEGANSEARSYMPKQPSSKVYSKKPIYTPLFGSPHPELVAEFCDFFGLCTSTCEAETNQVERFPVESLIVVGGGEAAQNVKTCLDLETPTMDPDLAPAGKQVEKSRSRQKYLQLTLASDEIRSLYAGGAKFSPMEAGLALCWIPVQGQQRPQRGDLNSKPSRAELSGRYGLLDEAAEWIGRCATKRILAMRPMDCRRLLTTGEIDLKELVEDKDNRAHVNWWAKWKKHQGADSLTTVGAVVVVCPGGPGELGDSTTVFLSCVLRISEAHAEPKRTLSLLTEQRQACSWLRLLESNNDFP